MVNSDTKNDEICAVALFKMVNPDTYNELLIVAALLKWLTLKQIMMMYM